MCRQKDNSSLYKVAKSEKPGSEQDFRVFLFHFIYGGLDHRLVTGYSSLSSHLMMIFFRYGEPLILFIYFLSAWEVCHMSGANYGFFIFMGAVLVFGGIPAFRGNLSLIH